LSAESFTPTPPADAQAIRFEDGHLVVPDRPGAGLAWNEEAVKRYAA